MVHEAQSGNRYGWLQRFGCGSTDSVRVWQNADGEPWFVECLSHVERAQHVDIRYEL